MSDFGTMVARIGNELHKPATSEDARIKSAIVTAIERYKYTRFWFNEDWMEFLTVAGTDSYVDGDFTLDDGSTNLPYADILVIDEPLVYNFGTNYRYPMKQLAWDKIEELKLVNSIQGYPDYWSRGYQRLRIWPIPNTSSHKVEGKIIRDFNTITAASADAVTNAWMVEAEELIRTSAMRDLYLTHYHNEEGARRVASLEAESLRRLRTQTELQLSGGARIEAYY